MRYEPSKLYQVCNICSRARCHALHVNMQQPVKMLLSKENRVGFIFLNCAYHIYTYGQLQDTSSFSQRNFRKLVLEIVRFVYLRMYEYLL